MPAGSSCGLEGDKSVPLDGLELDHIVNSILYTRLISYCIFPSKTVSVVNWGLQEEQSTAAQLSHIAARTGIVRVKVKSPIDS